jgi:hypothetical protein
MITDMKTVVREYEVYPFNELSEKAKENAYCEWIGHFEYAWSSENRATMKRFEEIFNISITHWSYDSHTYNYRFTSRYSAEEEELCGVRLLKYLVNNYWYALFTAKTYWAGGCQKTRKSRIFVHNDCVLTGYCLDYDILRPIYDFMKAPDNTTLHGLMNKCLNSFFKSCRDDMEYQISEEAFEEACMANDYEFLSDGKMFN